MTLPRDAWEKDSMQPGTTRPYNGEATFQLGKSYQVIHYNSVQNPNEVNLDSATLDSPSG